MLASTDVLDIDAEEGVGDDAVAGGVGHRSIDDEHAQESEEESESYPAQTEECLEWGDEAIVIPRYNAQNI